MISLAAIALLAVLVAVLSVTCERQQQQIEQLRARHARRSIPPHPRFGALLDTPPDGISVTRPDGRLIVVGGRLVGGRLVPAPVTERTISRAVTDGHPPWETAQFPAVPAEDNVAFIRERLKESPPLTLADVRAIFDEVREHPTWEMIP